MSSRTGTLWILLMIFFIASPFWNSSAIEYESGDFGKSDQINGVEGSFPVVATDHLGGVYVAYLSLWDPTNTQIPRSHIYFAYSHDFGATWSQSYRIDDDPRSVVRCESPSISIDATNHNIYISWKDNRTGIAEVYLDRSLDRGATFGNDTRVYHSTQDLVPALFPYTVSINAHQGKIYAAWVGYSSTSYYDSNIFFSSSLDGGNNFSSPIHLNPYEGDAIITAPDIAMDPDNDSIIYVSYCRRSSEVAYVHVVKSIDGGLSFSSPISPNDESSQRYTGGARLAISQDGVIHVVWTDNRSGDGPQYLDIYYASSEDGGLSFGPNIRVNDDSKLSPPATHPHFTLGAQGTPTIAIDSDSRVHIAWEDFRNFVDDTSYCRDTYYATKIGTSQFSSNFRINHIEPGAISVNNADPRIVFDSEDNLFIVYSDAPSGDNAHHSIFLMSVLSSSISTSTPATDSPTSTTLITSTTSLGSSTFPFQIYLIAIKVLYRKQRNA